MKARDEVVARIDSALAVVDIIEGLLEALLRSDEQIRIALQALKVMRGDLNDARDVSEGTIVVSVDTRLHP